MIYEISKREPMTDETVSIGSNVRCAYMKYPDLKIDEGFEVEEYDPRMSPPLINVPNVTISFMALAKYSLMHHKKCFQKYFDLVLVSNESLDIVSPDMVNLVEDNGKVLMETRKFFINLTKDAVKEYGEDIRKKASECGLKFEFDATRLVCEIFNLRKYGLIN